MVAAPIMGLLLRNKAFFAPPGKGFQDNDVPVHRGGPLVDDHVDMLGTPQAVSDHGQGERTEDEAQGGSPPSGAPDTPNHDDVFTLRDVSIACCR